MTIKNPKSPPFAELREAAKSAELAPIQAEPQGLAVQEMSVRAMIGQIVKGTITSESVAVMRELVALQREMDKDAARMSCNRAFAALQADCEPVKAMQVIPKGKGAGLRFANYESIREAVDPLLRLHGFSVSYSQKKDGPKTTVTCTLRHNEGHEITSEFTCGSVSGGENDAQRDAGTNTTANRMCLCNMLGIVIDKSGLDARMEGDTITPQEANAIGLRVEALYGMNSTQEASFLSLGGVDSWERMKRAKYEVVSELLTRQERKAAASKPKEPPANEKPFNPNDLELPRN